MIIFIIPHHKVGGAERVHSEIIKSVSAYERVLVVFDQTDSSPISSIFQPYPYIVLGTSRLRRYVGALGIIVLSRITHLTLFGCNSLYYYHLLRWVARKTVTIDLTHAFSYPDPGIEDYAKKFIPFISKRIVVNHKTLQDYKAQYDREDIDDHFLSRFFVIPNGVYIREFDQTLISARFKDFTIGYVGRFAPEKRPGLFLKLIEMKGKVDFKAKMFVDVFDANSSDYPHMDLLVGENDPEKIRAEFSKISLLFVTSSREGFPLVIMEAMELGIPVISTDVGSISEHVINDFNGYVFDGNEEDAFLDFCLSKIDFLGNDEKTYTRLSLNAREYAMEYFDIEKMHRLYRELLVNG